MDKQEAKRSFPVTGDREWELKFDEFDNVRIFQRKNSPWVEIETPQGAIAIWKRTGAVHPVTESGAVTDEPIDLPFPDEYPAQFAQGTFHHPDPEENLGT